MFSMILQAKRQFVQFPANLLGSLNQLLIPIGIPPGAIVFPIVRIKENDVACRVNRMCGFSRKRQSQLLH